MASLSDVIVDNFPPASGVALPLRTVVTVNFNVEMNTDRLEDDFFLQGPDTDQFVGEGLSMLTHPDNISQGDLDDFLKSPGYAGIVDGSFSFDVVSGVSTKLYFTPTQPLYPSTEYVVYIADTLDADGNAVTGFVTWTFETGTGSIEAIPSTVSSSVLASAPQAVSFATGLGPLSVEKTIPADHAIEQSTDLSEIVIEFNKDLDPSSITAGSIEVETTPATDHPQATTNSAGSLAKSIEVEGKRLKIKI